MKTTAIRVKLVHGRFPAWTFFHTSGILVPAGFVPGQRGSASFFMLGSPSHFFTITSPRLAHARDNDCSALLVPTVFIARIPRFPPAGYTGYRDRFLIPEENQATWSDPGKTLSQGWRNALMAAESMGLSMSSGDSFR